MMKKRSSVGSLQEQNRRDFLETFNDVGLYSSEEPGRMQKSSNQLSRKFVKLKPLRQSSPTKLLLKLTKQDREQRINMLLCVREVVTDYKENAECLTQPICDKIFSILETLSNQDSMYGGQMQTLFRILQRMIFCQQGTTQQINVTEYVTIESKPYSILINEALGERLKQLQKKEQEVEQKVEQINRRITEIESQNMDKLRLLKIQHDNNVVALTVDHGRTVNQLMSKIEELRQAIMLRDCRLLKLENSSLLSRGSNPSNVMCSEQPMSPALRSQR